MKNKKSPGIQNDPAMIFDISFDSFDNSSNLFLSTSIQNHLEFKMTLDMIFDISFDSFNNSSNLFLSTSIQSLIRQSQYFVSLADLSAICRN